MIKRLLNLLIKPLGMNKNEKLRRAKQSGLLDEKALKSYEEKLGNTIDKRQLAREKDTEDRICGLLLEREILKIHLESLIGN